MKTLKYILFNVLFLISLKAFAVINVKTYVPANASKHFLTLKNEIEFYLPHFKYPEYFAGLIEQESCISLTHSKCWRSDSELKTSREQGVGLGQITRAWNSTGGLRFDSLSDLKTRYPKELKEANWNTIKYRPDLQIRMILLMSRNNLNYYNKIPDLYNRLAFADSAYNGGIRLLDKERTICGLAKGCDPNLWFNNVASKNMRGSKVLYGKRTAWDINREHVDSVFNKRALVGDTKSKYISFLK